MYLSKIFLFIIMICTSLTGQPDGDVQLIRPIVESPELTPSQAKAMALNFNKTFNNWGIGKLGLERAMAWSTGKGVKICICDTGKPTHFDILDKIQSSKNFTTDPTDIDGNGHSTHVTGIITEIAPNAEILIAKVLTATGTGKTTWVANGIDWCVESGANIINLSLGSPTPSDLMKLSIQNATNKAVIIVAAVGNDGQSDDVDLIGYPAKWEETLGVGSINEQMGVSKFSSSGFGGDVVAPGELVLSTWLDNKYIVLSGTSMATPYISGMVALQMEINGGKEFPTSFQDKTNDMDPAGWDRFSFFGYPNPEKYFGLDSLPQPPKDTTTQPGPQPTPGEPGSSINWKWLGPFLVVVGFFVLYILLSRKQKDEA